MLPEQYAAETVAIDNFFKNNQACTDAELDAALLPWLRDVRLCSRIMTHLVSHPTTLTWRVRLNQHFIDGIFFHAKYNYIAAKNIIITLGANSRFEVLTKDQTVNLIFLHQAKLNLNEFIRPAEWYASLSTPRLRQLFYIPGMFERIIKAYVEAEGSRSSEGIAARNLLNQIYVCLEDQCVADAFDLSLISADMEVKWLVFKSAIPNQLFGRTAKGMLTMLMNCSISADYQRGEDARVYDRIFSLPDFNSLFGAGSLIINGVSALACRSDVFLREFFKAYLFQVNFDLDVVVAVIRDKKSVISEFFNAKYFADLIQSQMKTKVFLHSHARLIMWLITEKIADPRICEDVNIKLEMYFSCMASRECAEKAIQLSVDIDKHPFLTPEQYINVLVAHQQKSNSLDARAAAMLASNRVPLHFKKIYLDTVAERKSKLAARASINTQHGLFKPDLVVGSDLHAPESEMPLSDTETDLAYQIFLRYPQLVRIPRKYFGFTIVKLVASSNEASHCFAIYHGVKQKKHLGSGTFGVAKLAFLLQKSDSNLPNDWSVCKISKFNPGNDNSKRREIAIREHANLIRLGEESLLLERSEKKPSNQDRNQVIVMKKYRPGVCAAQLIRAGAKLSQADWLSIAISIIADLARYHRNQLVHMDISSNNVIIDVAGKRGFIIDPGNACEMGKSIKQSGTHYFMPREVLMAEVCNQPFTADAAIDVYSLGKLLLHLFRMIEWAPSHTALNATTINWILDKKPTKSKSVMKGTPNGNAIFDFLWQMSNDDANSRPSLASADALFIKCLSEIAQKQPGVKRPEPRDVSPTVSDAKVIRLR